MLLFPAVIPVIKDHYAEARVGNGDGLAAARTDGLRFAVFDVNLLRRRDTQFGIEPRQGPLAGEKCRPVVVYGIQGLDDTRRCSFDETFRERIERMILARVAGDFFQLPLASDREDDDER